MYIRFNWIIAGFFILRRLLAYTFLLEDISRSLIFVIQKQTNFLTIFTGKNSSLLCEICVLSGNLSEILAELNSMHFLLLLLLLLLLLSLLLLFRIHLLLPFALLILLFSLLLLVLLLSLLLFRIHLLLLFKLLILLLSNHWSKPYKNK